MSSNTFLRFSQPWTYDSRSSTQKRLPLSALPDDGRGHIHGLLELVLDGRRVPGLGYFGPDDVCINVWASELALSARTLAEADPGEYLFDEGEQGQPAYSFTRLGPIAHLSLIASELSGADGDSEWGTVPFPFFDYQTAVHLFLDQLWKNLEEEAPHAAHLWWQWVFGTPHPDTAA